jgi:hypothetical protein
MLGANGLAGDCRGGLPDRAAGLPGRRFPPVDNFDQQNVISVTLKPQFGFKRLDFLSGE